MNTKKKAYRYNISKMSISKNTVDQTIDILTIAKKLEKAKPGKEFDKTLNKFIKSLKGKAICTQVIITLIESGYSRVKKSLSHLPAHETVAYINEQKAVNAINKIEYCISVGLFTCTMIESFLELVINFQDLCKDMSVRISDQNGEIQYSLLVYAMIINEYVQRFD